MDLNNENQKKCSFCGEKIPDNAGRCPFCGSLLDIKIDDENFVMIPQQQEIQTFNSNEVEKTEITSYEKADETGNGDAAADLNRSAAQDPAVNQVPIQESYSKPPYNAHSSDGNIKKPLSNGLKVFLTILFTVIPGLGQLAGIITAIVFMNAEDDTDKKSFGVALLIASLIIFVLSCISCFIIAMVFSLYQSNNFLP